MILQNIVIYQCRGNYNMQWEVKYRGVGKEQIQRFNTKNEAFKFAFALTKTKDATVNEALKFALNNN